MAGEEACLVCDARATDELTCRLCSTSLHFSCAFGAEVNIAKSRAVFRTVDYTCPVCIIAKDNRLILNAVSRNQKYLAAKSNVVDFTLPVSFFAIPQDVLAEEEEAAPGQGDDPQGNGERAEEVLPDGGNSDEGSGDGSDEEDDDDVLEVDRRRIEEENLRKEEERRRKEREEEEARPGTAAPIHQACVTRAKRLLTMLNTLKNTPSHKVTVVLGDSNTHGTRGVHVDPESDTVVIRSISGLCIQGAAHAIGEYRHSYPHFKRVALSLGTNDWLHKEQHCLDDNAKHMKALEMACKKVFPGAKISFILPFRGLPKVSEDFIKELDGEIKAHCPSFKRHNPPSMIGKVKDDGVHINWLGRRAYANFLMRVFTKCKPPNLSNKNRPIRDSSRANNDHSGDTRRGNNHTGDQRTSGQSSFRVRSEQTRPPRFAAGQAPPRSAPTANPPNSGSEQDYFSLHPNQVVTEIAEALTQMMMSRRNRPQHYTREEWPR